MLPWPARAQSLERALEDLGAPSARGTGGREGAHRQLIGSPMTNRFAPGDLVEWRWYGFLIEGSVEEVFFERTVRTIKGSIIKRNGSRDNPAYLVRSDAGNLALKLQSELEPRSKRFDPRFQRHEG